MTSPFGWRWGRMHEGVDLACATGTTIRAADGGTVIRAGWYSGYGLCIDIDHGGCLLYTSVGKINIDNYDELIASTSPEKSMTISAEVDKTIRKWAAKINASIRCV